MSGTRDRTRVDCAHATTGEMLLAIINALNIQFRREGDVRQLTSSERGATIWVEGETYIVYDENDTEEERYFTIAHEIGHVLLDCNLSGNDKRRFEGRPICEYEADVFARGLLRLIERITE